jgi:hypothetical protein
VIPVLTTCLESDMSNGSPTHLCLDKFLCFDINPTPHFQSLTLVRGSHCLHTCLKWYQCCHQILCMVSSSLQPVPPKGCVPVPEYDFPQQFSEFSFRTLVTKVGPGTGSEMVKGLRQQQDEAREGWQDIRDSTQPPRLRCCPATGPTGCKHAEWVAEATTQQARC